jgi:AI-2 transport protein TqsA
MSRLDARSIRPIGEKQMTQGLSVPLQRFLQAVACVVIIMWGIRTMSHLLMLLLMALVLAYTFVPLPNWLMRQFKIQKGAALVLTVALLGTLNAVVIILLYDGLARMTEKLPVYHERFVGLFEKLMIFASAHGMTAGTSAAKLFTSDRMLEVARVVLRQAGGFLGDGLLISILAFIFLVEMAEETGGKRSYLAEKLAYYGGGVQRYISISAETGLITALANLVVLVALGVDSPVLWCVLYFFLHFIPNVGFILALLPPTLLALLMLGWKKALLVAGCLIVTQLLTDYALTPILMKKGVHISFLEIMVSLLFWGFLLGPAGAILAIPLTITLRKFIERFSGDTDLDGNAAGRSATHPIVEGSMAGA